MAAVILVPEAIDLKPETKPNTSSKVSGLSFATTDEDFCKLNWRAGFAVGCDGTDFKVFLFDNVRSTTANVNENVSGSCEIANGSIVLRRIRECLSAE